MNTFGSTVFIQAQDLSGIWRTFSVTMNDSQVILLSMRALKDQFPTYRVRAVDAMGRVVDILG